jgi:hypothetical protein
MPLIKFGSLEEMDAALWRSSDDPSLLAVIARVWAFADRTCPRRFPPGVYRHRTLQSANEQRDTWEEANFRSFWSGRRDPRA